MSYDLCAYVDAPCERAVLTETYATRFADHDLEVLAWDERGGHVRVTLRSRGGRGRLVATEVELVLRTLDRAPELGVPKSSRSKLAGVRLAYELSVHTEEEIAAAWTLCSALAHARGGFVDDPQDGITSTPSQASQRAARIVRGLLAPSKARPDDERLTPQQEAEERRAMFVAALGRHVGAETWTGFVESSALDPDLLRAGLALAFDARRADLTLALARRAPSAVLEAHAIEASRAPGLRSRLYLEHLVEAGVVDALPVTTLDEMSANLRQQREPELAAIVRARAAGVQR